MASKDNQDSIFLRHSMTSTTNKILKKFKKIKYKCPIFYSSQLLFHPDCLFQKGIGKTYERKFLKTV